MNGRPVPVPDALSAPFWESAARHELVMPCCSQCGGYSYPPDLTCPKCHSWDPQFSYKAVSGTGSLRTWTVVRLAFVNGFETPFILADVEVDGTDGVRVIGRLLEPAETELALGDKVRVSFEDLAPDIAVPGFKLEKTA